MKRNSFKKVFSVALTLVMVLGTMLAGTVSVSAVEPIAKAVTYTDDFSSYTQTTAPLNTTDYPCPGTSRYEVKGANTVIAEGSVFKYTKPETAPHAWAYSLVDLDNDALLLQSGHNRDCGGANVSLVDGDLDTLTNVTVNYTTPDDKATGTGINLFSNSAENTYYRFYHVPSFSTENYQYTPGYDTYLKNLTVNNNYAYVAQVKDGAVSVIALTTIVNADNVNIYGPARNYQWNVSINNGIISWTFTTYTAAGAVANEWKGSFTEGTEVTRINHDDVSETKVTLEALSTSDYAYPLSLIGNSSSQGMISETNAVSVMKPVKITEVSLSGTVAADADPIFADDFTGYTTETAPINETNYAAINTYNTGDVIGNAPNGFEWTVPADRDSDGIATAYIDTTNDYLYMKGRYGQVHQAVNLGVVNNGTVNGIKKIKVNMESGSSEAGVRFFVNEAENSYYYLAIRNGDINCGHENAANDNTTFYPIITKVINGTETVIRDEADELDSGNGTWLNDTSWKYAGYQDRVSYEFIVEVAGNVITYTLNEYKTDNGAGDGSLMKTWTGTVTDTDGIMDNVKYPIAPVYTGSNANVNLRAVNDVEIWADYVSYINAENKPVIRIMPYEYTNANGDINIIAATYGAGNSLDYVEIKTIVKADALTGVAELTFGAVDTNKLNKLFLINGEIDDIIPLDKCIEYK